MNYSKKIIWCFVLCFALTSCQTLVKTTTENYFQSFSVTENVEVFNISDTLPRGIKRVGTIKVSDSAFTPTHKCTFDACVLDAKKKAANMGGNVLQIIKHTEPSALKGTCHSIECVVYRK